MNMKKLFNNQAGVSPIVATLVLVVVAIAGAAAVGTIMGSFSSDVSDQASAGTTADASSTTLRLAGSSTVTPVAELIAEDFMTANDGIIVDVQEGGSDAGISAAMNDLVDIGMASKEVDKEGVEVHTIGYSAVAVIVNAKMDPTTINASSNVTAATMKAIYDAAGTDGAVEITFPSTLGGEINASAGGDFITVYQRSDASGTEETFAKWLGGTYKTDKDVDSSKASGQTGNQGVLDAVLADDQGMGFVDYGFAKAAGDDVIVLRIDDRPVVTESEIKAAIRGDDDEYDVDLTRPLNFLTHGTPSSLEQAFIDFAMNPANHDNFKAVGYYARTQIDY